jgi:hypothetical protein
MYLVACNCDASLYSFTDSPVWLHGGLWYFQLPQIYTLAKSLDVLDQIIVVGTSDSFEDDIVITLNSLDTGEKNLLYTENDYNGFDILRWNLAVITALRARHALPPSRAFCFLTRPTPIHTLHLLSL